MSVATPIVPKADEIWYLGWGQSPHGGPYLVCEYVDGQPLTQFKPYDSETSVQWLAQICQAVAAAHDAGVVHGDLNPNNILLDHNARIVVTDFGFATYMRTLLVDGVPLESIASLGGTLGFAAPEYPTPSIMARTNEVNATINLLEMNRPQLIEVRSNILLDAHGTSCATHMQLTDAKGVIIMRGWWASKELWQRRYPL